MMFRIAFLFVFCAMSSYAQVDVNRFSNIVQSVSSGSAAYGSGFKGSYKIDSRIKGSPYLDTAFVQSSFRFYKTTANLVAPSRNDLLNGELEVQTTGGIRVLNYAIVNFFKTYEHGDSIKYVNASNYTFEDTKLIGFMKVLSEGKMELLELTKIEIIKPSYNPSLEVGDKDSHLVKKSSLFYSHAGFLYKVKGKKEILQLFGDKKGAVESYISSNKLDFKKQEDLVQVFNYYNKL